MRHAARTSIVCCGRRFVDLHRVVRGALRAGVESYSIKQLEGLTGFERAVPLEDARRTLRVVEHCLEDGGRGGASGDVRVLVEGYNRDDCASTRALRDWLESLRPADTPDRRPRRRSRARSWRAGREDRGASDRASRGLRPERAPRRRPSCVDCSRICSTSIEERTRRSGGSTTGCSSCPRTNPPTRV